MSDKNYTPDWQHDSNTVVEESRPKLKKPSLYKVVLLNDDFTPMEFVVELLELFWQDARERYAHHVKYSYRGKGVCGIYTQDVADESGHSKSVLEGPSASASM